MQFRFHKVIILLVVLYAIVCMWHWTLGFTFFTQLSNLFIALTVLLQLIAGEGKLSRLKFAATVAIQVTFLVYLTLLGPISTGGLWEAYRQDHYASLCMHVLVPAAALADYLLNDRQYVPRRGWPLYALLPPLVWFALILILGAAGLRWNGMGAPYPFLNYLAPAGWFGFQPGITDGRSIGIGVAYCMMSLVLLFLLVGFLIQMTGRIGKRTEAEKAV